MDSQQEIEALKKILERERAARKQAEQIIEEKATELYVINLELKTLNQQLETKVGERTRDIVAKNRELQLTGSRLELLAHNLHFGLLMEDENRQIVLANRLFCELFGISVPPEALVGADCSNSAEQTKHLFENPEQFVNAIEELLRARVTRRNEEIKMRDGRIVSRDFIPIWNGDQYQGHLWVYNEITEKKNMDIRISEQRQFYEDILNNIPADIAVFDRQHRYLFLNPIAIADPELRQWMIGKTDEDYCRLRGKDLSIADSRRALFNRVMEQREQFEWEEKLMNRQGTPGYYLRKLYPVKDEQGNVQLVIGYGLNITERKKAEQETKRSEKRYRDLIDFSLALICTHDEQGVLLTVNPAICSVTGYAVEEMCGRKISEFMPSEDLDNFSYYQKEILEKGKAEGVFRIISKEGRCISLLFQNYRMEEEGQKPYIIGFSQDITERIEAEKELLEAKKLTEDIAKAKESFLANMSHEIRTPMNGVMGIAGLLAKTQLDEQQRSYLKLIQESSNNLLVIVNDILDLEKIVMGKLQMEHVAFCVPERVETCVQSFTYKAEEKGIQLKYNNRLKKDLSVINDPYRLSQVLNNLISNALKFTEQGEVSVETSLEEHQGSRLFIRFSVSDTGIGIPEEKLAEIFEPFVQANVTVSRTHGGTGLGLSICRELIHMMGGVLKVKSVPGEGSTFYFVLPFEISSMTPAQQNVKEAHIDFKSLGHRHVLVAEDVELNQFLAKHILESWGFTVSFASNGEEAVAKVLRDKYDLVLMDIQMPVMDGMDAARKIRLLDDPAKASVPIIALTANALKGDSEKYLKAGMNDYLAKPFTEEGLFRVIQNSLEPIPNSVHEISYAIPKPRIMETREKLYDLAMVETISGGDKDFVITMIRLFIETMPETVAELVKNQKEENWEATGRIAHKLKSTIDSMGIELLKKDIRTLEANARGLKEVDTIPALVRKVEEIVSACVAQLKNDFSI